MKHANASFTATGHCEERQKIIKVKFDHFYFRLPLKNDFETIYTRFQSLQDIPMVWMDGNREVGGHLRSPNGYFEEIDPTSRFIYAFYAQLKILYRNMHVTKICHIFLIYCGVANKKKTS